MTSAYFNIHHTKIRLTSNVGELISLAKRNFSYFNENTFESPDVDVTFQYSRWKSNRNVVSRAKNMELYSSTGYSSFVGDREILLQDFGVPNMHLKFSVEQDRYKILSTLIMGKKDLLLRRTPDFGKLYKFLVYNLIYPTA